MGRQEVGRIICFGSFEVDLAEGRLTKAGIRIRLQEQPFQILALLLVRPGQLVTREEIRQKLWSDETFVEFDDALNTAVRKLRAALGDSADNPRFLETVPRRGYRFVAPVSVPAETQINQSPAQPTSAEAPVPSGSDVAQVEVHQPPLALRKTGWRRLTLSIAAALLVAAATGIYWRLRHPAFQVTSKDTIVLADFVNTTGEAVLDDALRQGLEVGLEQSPLVRVLSDRKAAVILKQMGRSPDERMAGRTAIEVCQRTGAKLTVQGSIASLGTTYLIGLAAIRCDNGEPIANEQVAVKRKEDVVNALGQATAHLRDRLGESLPSIQKYNAPLEQATTPSLEALNTYGMALSTWDRKGNQDSLPLFKRAVELDPNFAMAHSALATIYHNLGESELAREYTTKAYDLRDRVTETERASIEGRYYSYVTGELEKAVQVYALLIQNYPDSPNAYNHLGDAEQHLGHYESSAERFRVAQRLDPTRAHTYAALAADLLALNRVDEAATVLTDAGKRGLRTDSLLRVSYWIAFLRNDNAEMRRILLLSPDIPGAQSILLLEQADTEADYGHLEQADDLSRVAAKLIEHDGNKEAAADCLAQAALREAEVGNSKRAQAFLSPSQKLSDGPETLTLAALVVARLGDLKHAEALSAELDKQWPAGTFIQRYWLPIIRAEIDIQQGRSSKAIDDLAVATPLELAGPSALPVATIYPAYVRGQAYLAAGDGKRASAEFQKLTDHAGLVLNFPLGALAHLGLARAYNRSGDLEKARQAYQDFLTLWKEADPHIPILKEAKAEYAKLQ